MQSNASTPTSGQLTLTETTQFVRLDAEFLPVLQAAAAGGSAVDDYFGYVNEKAKSLNGLLQYLAQNDLTDDTDSDGTPIKLAQAGDAGVRIRVDVSQTSQDQTTYSAAGTVSMLAGTNMHHTLFAALEFTGLGVALTWEVLARLGLTSLAGIYRACAQAAVGAGADPAAIEMAVQGAAQEAANAPVEAAAEGGAEVALEGAAAVEATNPVTLPLAIATVLVTLAGELLQKTMFHWLDVYNLTGMDLQLQQPWDDHASFSLALNPLTLAATKTEPDGQTKNVTYGSWMAQNKSGFRGLAYMVYVEPSGTFPGLLATMHVPFAEDNTIALQFKTTSDDWSDWSAVWDKQTRTTSNNLDVTSTNGNFRAILTMNAPSGSEDQFKSTLFIIDTNLFPNFTPRS